MTEVLIRGSTSIDHVSIDIETLNHREEDTRRRTENGVSLLQIKEYSGKVRVLLQSLQRDNLYLTTSDLYRSPNMEGHTTSSVYSRWS